MGGSTGPLLGVIIGASVTLLVTLLSVWKDHLQSQRALQADKEKWLRDRLHEIYSNCLYYSKSKGIGGHGWIGPDDRKEKGFEYGKVMIDQSRLELQYQSERLKWFNLLAIHHPFRGTPEYEAFVQKIGKDELQTEDVVSLASRDPRLKIDYGVK